ncbi:MAG: 2-amino-4-hydroxy-6-hydroxymethyldihydropteridine diphosphokinase [Thermodesulfobacteriota bacterium]
MADHLASVSGEGAERIAYIGLGSNLGDGRGNLLLAWRLLAGRDAVRPLVLSSPWLSSPVAMESAQWFTNAVGRIATGLAPDKLLAELLAVEYAMGRRRREGRDRIIDLDILAYGEATVAEPALTIPHPEMHRRLFVLAPLAEIAPDFVHPVLLRSAAEMLALLRENAGGQQIRKTDWPAEAAA